MSERNHRMTAKSGEAKAKSAFKPLNRQLL
jgi:hypothetical protein